VECLGEKALEGLFIVDYSIFESKDSSSSGFSSEFELLSFFIGIALLLFSLFSLNDFFSLLYFN
jgi:hypothetical protein